MHMSYRRLSFCYMADLFFSVHRFCSLFRSCDHSDTCIHVPRDLWDGKITVFSLIIYMLQLLECLIGSSVSSKISLGTRILRFLFEYIFFS